MSSGIFNYVGNLDTLIAVIVGAVLATGGALIAEKVQARSMIKQREQDAARRLGHILFDIDRSLARTFHSQTIGEPWGLASRMAFVGVAKKGEWYVQNRDCIFDIQDMELRIDLSEDVSSLIGAISGLVRANEQIEAEEKLLIRDHDLSPKHRELITAELKQTLQTRELAIPYIQLQLALIQKHYPKLEELAGTSFSTKSSSNRHMPADKRENPTNLHGQPVNREDVSGTK